MKATAYKRRPTKADLSKLQAPFSYNHHLTAADASHQTDIVQHENRAHICFQAEVLFLLFYVYDMQESKGNATTNLTERKG